MLWSGHSKRNFEPIIAGDNRAKYSVETIFRKKDGAEIVVLLDIRLLHNPAGDLVGFRSTMQDITDRKQAEE